jgi:hypothetical protein
MAKIIFENNSCSCINSKNVERLSMQVLKQKNNALIEEKKTINIQKKD